MYAPRIPSPHLQTVVFHPPAPAADPEPTTRETGALRVIAGSHRQPLNGELHEALDALNTQFGGTHGHRGIPTPFGVAADELACFCFESMPGDVIAFTENCWHAAFGGADGRQQHAISFQANPRTALELEHLEAGVARYNFALHPPAAMRASQRPRIQAMIRRVLELGASEPRGPVGTYGKEAMVELQAALDRTKEEERERDATIESFERRLRQARARAHGVAASL